MLKHDPQQYFETLEAKQPDGPNYYNYRDDLYKNMKEFGIKSQYKPGDPMYDLHKAKKRRCILSLGAYTLTLLSHAQRNDSIQQKKVSKNSAVTAVQKLTKFLTFASKYFE